MLGSNKIWTIWAIAIGILLNQTAAEAAKTPVEKLEINGDIRFYDVCYSIASVWQTRAEQR